jgi:Bacterial tandem repeat domain 1
MKSRTTQLMLDGRLLAITALTMLCCLLWLSAEPSAPSGQAAVSYPFPGRAEDLGHGEYWHAGGQHAAGIQGLGHDLTGARFNAAENVWTGLKAGKPGTYCKDAANNDDCIIYGKTVHAIASGKVARCWRNAPENPKPGEKHPGVAGGTIPGSGNGLWIQHDDGSLVLYAHLQPGTIPANLCPIEAEFISEPDEPALPPDNQPQVQQGQYLGKVGNSGQSSLPHLHIHRQQTPPLEGNADDALPLPFHGAWVKSSAALEDDPADWERLQGEAINTFPTAILPDYSQGFAEIARHGIPANEYQFAFDHITESGYRPVWVDGYEVNGDNYFNAIFRPADGAPWAARHGLNATQYQDEFDLRKSQGYRPLQVESYTDGAVIRYAVIFVKQAGPEWVAYHGRTVDEHQELFDALTRAGFRPINNSVVAPGGQLSYTTLYERKYVGSFIARSFLTSGEYQNEYDANKAAGRQLVYLNAYEYAGDVRFTAIWHAAVAGVPAARHGLTGAQYQDEWEHWTGLEYLTRCVTGYGARAGAHFAALWRK